MLTLATPPELEIRLAAEAQKRGIKAEDYALEILLDGLAQSGVAADTGLETAMDEASALFDDIPFGTSELRAMKEEEMALEEARHERLFGKDAP